MRNLPEASADFRKLPIVVSVNNKCAPISRGFIIDGKRPHTTPVIVEIASGTPWSVDSWTKALAKAPTS